MPVQIGDNVTCEQCRTRLNTCPTNEHGFPLASEKFVVGNTATVEMGHQFYHTEKGRIALCVATRKPPDLDKMLADYQLSAQELIQTYGKPLTTTAEVIAALDSYGEGRAAGIHQMASDRSLDPANLTLQQYKDLLLEEADWSDSHAAHPVVQKEEAEKEKRHAAVMRGMAGRIVI